MTSQIPDQRFETITDASDSDLLCILCKKIMSDARKSVCGCNYCLKCITEYMVNIDNKYCPGGTVKCKEGELILERDVLIDDAINDRISKLIVKCHSCHVRLELNQMSEHFRSCPGATNDCPFRRVGCCDNEGMVTGKLRTHFDTELIKHTSLLIEMMAAMKTEVDDLKRQLIGNQIEITALKDELKDNKLEICMLKNELRCTSGELVVKETEVEPVEELMKGNVALEAECIEEAPEVKITQQTPQIDSMKNIENELRSMKSEISTKLKTTNETIYIHSKKLGNLQLQYNNLTKEIIDLKTFEYVWKIDNFSTIIRRKFVTKRDAISDDFYTHSNGYKLRLAMYLNVYESEKYLVIYLCFLPGQFDRIVTWPFTGTITLGLIDQSTGTVCFPFVANQKTASDEFNYVFEKPKKHRGEGYGYDIKLREISQSSSLVVKDSVFVKCSVLSHMPDNC